MRRVGDLDPVVDFVAFFQSTQYRDGVLHRRLVHQDLLEAALEGGVLLDVLAVLVQRGGADAVQLAARERGLEHVAGVHRALRLARAHHRVHLVDEEDHLPLHFGEVGEHGLEALLELAAELGPGDECAHVEREQPLAGQPLRHLVVDDALREPLHDGGLAHAGLADQDRVVLGAALQHLDGAPDLGVAADDGVEFPLFGALGEVEGEALQRLALVLGVGGLDFLSAAYLLHRSLDGGAGGTGAAQDLARGALVVDRREQEQLRGDELVVAILRELVGDVEQAVEVAGDEHLARRALHARHAVDGLHEAQAQLVHAHTGLHQDGPRAAALLVEQGHQHVHGFHELVVAADSQALRIGKRQLKLGGQLVHPHVSTTSSIRTIYRRGSFRQAGQRSLTAAHGQQEEGMIRRFQQARLHI